MDVPIQFTPLGSHILLLLIWLVPLGLAVALLFSRCRTLVSQLAPWAALPALLIAYGTQAGGEQSFAWALLGMQLGLDATAQTFLGFSALIWGIAGFFALHSLRDSPRQAEFILFFLLSMSGNFGVIIAQEASSFYFFYALMGFSAYGLVIYQCTADNIRAGWIYLGFVIVGEMCLLVAILASVMAAGDTELSLIRAAIADSDYQNLIILMLLLGFGSKLGLLGAHFSLPIAYRAIPLAGAIVLGGAMLNAGLLGWLRFLPLGEMSLSGWGHLFISLGILAAFFGVVVGLLQTHIQALLAYSSISQMGLITIIIGFALQQPDSPLIMPLLLAYALHHALAKGALFLGAGMVKDVPNGTWRWLLLLSLLLPALSIAGISYSSGMAVKTVLKTLVGDSDNGWQQLLPLLLMLSSLATTLLLGRYFWLVMRQARGEKIVVLPWSVISAWVVLLSAIIAVAVQLNADYASLLAKKNLLWEAIPVLLGMVLVTLAFGFAKHWRLPSLPAGDVFWWLWRIVPQLSCLAYQQFINLRSLLPSELPSSQPLQTRLNQWLALEEQLLMWQVAGLILLGLLIGALALTMV